VLFAHKFTDALPALPHSSPQVLEILNHKFSSLRFQRA